MPQASRTLRQRLEVSARTQTAQPFQLLSSFVPVDTLCFMPTAQDSPVPTFSDQDSSSRDRQILLVGRCGFKAHQTITAPSPEPATHRSSAFLSHRPTKCSFVLSNLSITLRAPLEASTQAEDETCRTCLSVCSWPRSPRGFVHPLREDMQDGGTNTSSLKRELFADHVTPCSPRSSAPKRCCVTSMASCLRSPPCPRFISSRAIYKAQH